MDTHLVSLIAMPLWLPVSLIGLQAATLIFIAVIWWRITRMGQEHHTENLQMLTNITAIAQTIAAQNREVLRRLEDQG